MPPDTVPDIRPPYQAMAQLAAPAAARSEVWRTVLGLILTAAFSTALIVVVMTPVIMVLGPDRSQQIMASAMAAGTATGVIGLLFAFVPVLFGLALTLPILMRRNPVGLLGPLGPFARNFLKVGLPLMALWLAMMPFNISGNDVRPHLTLAQLTPWLPWALIGLLLQTATEEALFRGYLQQQLAARFSARWVWLGVPALLFGMAHFSGDYPLPLALLTMAWATCFGLVAADLTARSGNLGAALALHFTNNISAILLVGFAGPLGGLSLYTVTPSSDTVTLTYFATDAIGLLVAWLLARLMLRR